MWSQNIGPALSRQWQAAALQHFRQGRRSQNITRVLKTQKKKGSKQSGETVEKKYNEQANEKCLNWDGWTKK